jgi:hypothetical protein
MYYVTTTDSFTSGWGKAGGKTNKLIFPCDTYADALVVAENAENRSDQKRVNIRSTKPYYNAEHYLAQIKTRAEYPSWHEKGYFKKG